MHEMGIVSGILSSAVEAAEKEGASKINDVRVSVGVLTEIQDFALQFAWEALTPGTIAEGGDLVVTFISPLSKCSQCDTEFEHDRFEIVCPTCGNFVCELLKGRELTIDSIDID